ncbi:hypothetical protein HDU97_001908 [Phlyctochytrium planicorne]|nr:hypothetical protein HDU97_001908 [Phlyctochytrium planicorne]
MIVAVATVISSLVAVRAAPALQPRSNYPPNYAIMSNCKTDGPVTACAINKDFENSFPRLQITYSNTGDLWSQGSPLSAWVQVNDHADTFGTFTADRIIFPADSVSSASFAIGDARDVQYCYHPTTGDNATFPENSPISRCPVSELFPLIQGGAEQGTQSYFYNPAPQKEQNLINPAKGRAWNVQVAVFNAKGSWDSKNGQNYHFTL